MELNVNIWEVLAFFGVLIFPFLALYICLYHEKKNAIKVINYYDSLLKLRLNKEQPDSALIMELDTLNRVKFVRKFIRFVPFLPFANILKHLDNSLQKDEAFVKKCNEDDSFIFNASVQEIFSQRDNSMQFYFMAEMLTCRAMVKSGVWLIMQHLVADLARPVHHP